MREFYVLIEMLGSRNIAVDKTWSFPSKRLHSPKND